RLQASHPDHIAVGEATVRAVYPAVENPFAYPDLGHLPAFRIGQLWMMGAPADLVNLCGDITDYVDMKLEALHQHNSQHPDTPGPRGCGVRSSWRMGFQSSRSWWCCCSVPRGRQQ